LLLLTINGFSQIQKPQNNPLYDYEILHFGFSVAVSTMNFAIRPADNFFAMDSVASIENKIYPGFNINIVSNLRLTEDLDLRFLPGLAFGQRDLIYTYKIDEPDKRVKIESIFIETPVLLKYKSKRLNNHRPYVIGGFNYRFDMDGKEIKKIKEDRIRRLNRSDLYFEIGAGVDYYLPYFRLSSELKFSIGLLDILKRDNSQLTTSMDKMLSRMVILTFHFE